MFFLPIFFPLRFINLYPELSAEEINAGCGKARSCGLFWKQVNNLLSYCCDEKLFLYEMHGADYQSIALTTIYFENKYSRMQNQGLNQKEKYVNLCIFVTCFLFQYLMKSIFLPKDS